MICNAKDLSPKHKVVLEPLLGPPRLKRLGGQRSYLRTCRPFASTEKRDPR